MSECVSGCVSGCVSERVGERGPRLPAWRRPPGRAGGARAAHMAAGAESGPAQPPGRACVERVTRPAESRARALARAHHTRVTCIMPYPGTPAAL